MENLESKKIQEKQETKIERGKEARTNKRAHLPRRNGKQTTVKAEDRGPWRTSLPAAVNAAMTESDLRPAMAAARSAGDNLRIQAIQRIFDGRERERTRASLQHGGPENTECGICFDPLEIPRSDTLDFLISAATSTGTFRWPGSCRHFFHGQCLTNFRARTSTANLSCPNCRAPKIRSWACIFRESTFSPNT